MKKKQKNKLGIEITPTGQYQFTHGYTIHVVAEFWQAVDKKTVLEKNAQFYQQPEKEEGTLRNKYHKGDILHSKVYA